MHNRLLTSSVVKILPSSSNVGLQQLPLNLGKIVPSEDLTKTACRARRFLDVTHMPNLQLNPQPSRVIPVAARLWVTGGRRERQNLDGL